MPGKTPSGFDRDYYASEISPRLPGKILDFHTHVWTPEQWKGYSPGAGGTDRVAIASESTREHTKYMESSTDYPVENLLADGAFAFPDKEYKAVVFGQPCPDVDTALTNAYVARSAAENERLFPLRVTGAALPDSIEQVSDEIKSGGFYGYKVYLNWVGDQYPPLTFQDMVSEQQCALADREGLVILLHVPRSGRLADPEVGKSVRDAALRWPKAKFVLAHCGRCYLYEEIRAALHWVSDLHNVWFDCSMVMEPSVVAYILQRMDASRFLFATDYPIAAMRGRRVNIADHWVDVVLPGPAQGHYRVITDNMRASIMTYEIVKAVLIGADLAGVSEEKTAGIFHDNGMDLLNSVLDSRL